MVPIINYHPIQDVIEQLKNEYDWTHSFIRECYFATSHSMWEYVDGSGVTQLGDVQGAQSVRLVIACTGNTVDSGIEFLFRNVSVFSVQTFDELHLQYDYDLYSGHAVRFCNAEQGRECYIYAKSVFVRFLGRKYLGIDLMLGFEFPTSEAFDAKVVEGCWRQCANCSNAWEEISKVEFSRCPACGEVTKLKI